MNISIKTIPHSEQRYPTCGDWFFEGEDLQIRVSKLSSLRYEWLIIIHELAEAFLCRLEGIPEESITRFDIEFEKNRHPNNFDEPGDSPNAPYFKQHCIATGIERLMAACLGVRWSVYEKEIESL